MHRSVQRVAEALSQLGVEAQIIEFSQSTRTAQEAADAIGTTVAQIVKSLVFLADGRPILALVSGAHRLDLDKLRQALGAANVVRADADAVRAATGYAIGGVPPVGHAQALPVVMDEELARYEVVYAAAGTPFAVFAITPGQLQQVSRAQVLDLAER